MATICVVMLGLSLDHPSGPEHLRPSVRKTLAAVDAQMTEAGFKYEFIMVLPEEGVARLDEKLHSPDVVVIGNGIRSNMVLTPFLEQIIEVVLASAPKAKLAFNTLPENSVEAVRRVCPAASPA